MAARVIAVALGADGATVLAPGVEGALALPASLPAAAEDPAAALLDLFARIQEALAQPEALQGAAETRLRVRVSLLPPLCDAKLIPLPPLRPEETQGVLRRDAVRHFLGSSRPLIVGGERIQDGRSGAAGPVLAAAAPRSLVDALQRAVEARGWELDRIAPAHGAWLRALHSASAGAGGAGSQRAEAPVRVLIALLGDTAHVLRTVGGAAERIRRLPAGDTEGVLGAAGPEAGSALLLAEESEAATLAEALAGAGWVVERGDAGSARMAAARHAGEAAPELVPAPLAWARKERSRRTTVRMLAASIVVVAAAAVVHLLGTVREHRSVQRERAEIRSAVAPALAARDSLDRIAERVETLQALGREAARWTFSLVEISVLLPGETHLISLRAAGDTVVIEAEGGHAGDALEALRTATTLEDVRIEGTIQREIEDGSSAGERFTLSAVLSRRSKEVEGAGHVPAPGVGAGAPDDEPASTTFPGEAPRAPEQASAARGAPAQAGEALR
jgi:hypothetical protein